MGDLAKIDEGILTLFLQGLFSIGAERLPVFTQTGIFNPRLEGYFRGV